MLQVCSTGKDDKNQRVVLTIVGEGVRLHFVDPNSPGQAAALDFATK